MNHSSLIAEFLSTPWAMMPERMRAFANVLARRLQGERLAMEDDEIPGGQRRNTFDARRAEAQGRASADTIAVLPLYGSIMQRANMMTEWCGGTSTQQFSSALRDAIADPTVSAIVIDIDSPGGSVYGVGELAAEIYDARSKKPVVGIANSLAASAAYWAGAACSELYITPGGEVGSIGVWQAHEDWSKALDEAGIKTTLISAGKFKVEGNPYEPLDDDALAFMQSRVNDYYDAFAKGVAKGRNVPVGSVRDGMGQGRVLGASDAQAQGMVDGIMTFDDVIRKVQRDTKNSSRGGSRVAKARREIDLLG